MGAGGISISYERRLAVQFTKSYIEGKLIVAVAVRGKKSGFFQISQILIRTQKILQKKERWHNKSLTLVMQC